MSDILYPVVDDQDQVMDHLLKDQAYARGFMLRSVQIFVYNGEGRLFVQKRGPNKKRFPNYYCASVAGHVEPGESYEDAAVRELAEELGIVAPLSLVTVAKTAIGDNEYAMMAHFTATSNDPVTIQESEIDSGAFYTNAEVEKMIKDGEPFTSTFLYFFAEMKKRGNP